MEGVYSKVWSSYDLMEYCRTRGANDSTWSWWVTCWNQWYGPTTNLLDLQWCLQTCYESGEATEGKA